jgi:hypothetical protein
MRKSNCPRLDSPHGQRRGSVAQPSTPELRVTKSLWPRHWAIATAGGSTEGSPFRAGLLASRRLCFGLAKHQVEMVGQSVGDRKFDIVATHESADGGLAHPGGFRKCIGRYSTFDNNFPQLVADRHEAR